MASGIICLSLDGPKSMRLETRGPEIGPCNICGKIAKLTEDHIPPKGVPRVGQAYATSLVAALGAQKVGKGSRLF